MTLTQHDLNAIGNLIETKLEEKLEVKLEQKLKPIKKDLKAIRKDLNWVIGRYDKRLIHLEKHLTHPPHQCE